MVLGSDTSKEARTTTSLLSLDALYTQCYSFYGLHLHFTNFKQFQELDIGVADTEFFKKMNIFIE